MPVSSSFVSVVTGGNRGLGLEFVRQLLTGEHDLPSIPKDTIVVATARNPSNSDALNALRATYGDRLDIVKVDVVEDADNAALVEHVAAKYGRTDLLILNAGAGVLDNFDNFKRSDALSTITINALAPAEQARHFKPLLEATVALKKIGPTNAPPPVRVVFISSIMGSIGGLESSICLTYKASKTTLNVFARAFATENPTICVQIQHPGWVQTDMGTSGGRRPPLTPHDSISGVLKCVDAMTLAKSGKAFVSYDGEILPW